MHKSNCGLDFIAEKDTGLPSGSSQSSGGGQSGLHTLVVE